MQHFYVTVAELNSLLVYKNIMPVIQVSSEIRAAGCACNQGIICSSYFCLFNSFNLFSVPLYNWHEKKLL